MEHPARELFQQVCREIGNLLPCDRISLALPSPQGSRFVIVTVHPEGDGPTWEVPQEGSCVAAVLKKRKAEFITNLGGEFRYPEEESLYKQGIRDAAFLPLLLALEPTGVLILGSKEPRTLEGRGVRLLERVSGLIAAAIAATRWERPAIVSAAADPQGGSPSTALQRAYRQMVAFSRASNRIVQEDDLGATCRLFLETIREHSGYRRAVLTLLDLEGRDAQWYFTGFSDADIDYFHAHKMKPAQRASIFQERYKTGNSYCVPASASINFGGLRPTVRGGSSRGAEDAVSLLFIPLYGAGGTIVGTVMLDDPQGEAATPSAEALSSLELFVCEVAHAIEKKRLDLAVKTAQARLRAAQEQLMQAEKLSAIGQLISGVTHELNNPLAGVMGFAQLLLGSEVNPKVRKNLERIYNEAVRCQRIVENLLTFSRRHKPEKTVCGLHEVIDSVLELRAYQLQVDDVTVERRYDSDLPKTMLDFHQIQQVVLNVINNAHHAMMQTSDRPRRLLITTAREGEILRARFTDTGTGIPRDRLEKIFQPFFTTKEAGKGTGLGLSLSRAIIRDHHGTIRAESRLGEGTTLTIELPLIGGAEGAEEVRHDADRPAPSEAPLRLLVVDDEEVLTDLLSDYLQGAGHKVDKARDGRRALELVRQNDYDVILSDLKMPGMDGQGLYEQVLKIKPEAANRFVFSTGDLANPKVQTFFQTIGCLYVSKPFKLEAVARVLAEVARRARAA